MKKNLSQNVKDMLGGLIWVYIIAFLVLAFFSPWAARLVSAI